MSAVLLSLFLAALALDWPALPANARLAELLVVPAALAVLMSGGGGWRWRPLDLAVLAYLGGSAVGVITSADPAASAVEWGRHGYLAGIYALVALAVGRGLARPAGLGLALMGAAHAIAALAVAVVWFFVPVDVRAAGEVMTLPYVGDVLRLRGFTFSPTMFACALTVALPFAMAGAIEARSTVGRRWWFAVSALMGLAAVMTFSHVWAGVALVLTMMSWPALRTHGVRRAAAVAAVVVLTVVFNATLIASVRSVSRSDLALEKIAHPYAVDTGSREIAGYRIDYAVMSYGRIKHLAVEAFLAQPLTGVGLDRFHDVTRAAYAGGRLPHGYREIDPHSALLGRLAETGLLGGATLAILWVAIVRTGLAVAGPHAPHRWLGRAAVAGVLGLLLAGINVDIMNFRFLWAAFGVIRGLAEIVDSRV